MNALSPCKPLFCELTEQTLLGTLLINPEAFERAEMLQPFHFFCAVNGRIFETLRGFYNQGKNPPLQQIARAFDTDPDLSTAGGGQYVIDLAEAAGDTVSTSGRADYIVGLHQMRCARAHAARIIEVTESFEQGANPQEMRSQLEQVIQEWDTGGAEKNENGISALVDDERKKREHPTGKILTGIKALDAQLNGLFNGQLIIVAARPSVGKSALAATLSYNIARQGNQSFYFSLEMSASENVRRILSRLVGQDIHGSPDAYKQVDPDKLKKAEDHLKTLPIVMNDSAGQSLSNIISRIRYHKRKHDTKIAFIDQLSHIHPSDTKQVRTYQIEETTRALKQLARSLDIPIVLFCQLKRPPAGSENRRPGMTDLKDSGAIEQDADTIILIHREECAEYDAGTQSTAAGFKGTARTKSVAELADKAAAKGQAELLITKVRQGTRGTVHVKFNGERQHFHD
jgi:replicative DNA helicase